MPLLSTEEINAKNKRLSSLCSLVFLNTREGAELMSILEDLYIVNNDIPCNDNVTLISANAVKNFLKSLHRMAQNFQNEVVQNIYNSEQQPTE